ncbi:MAG: alkaline ceramidase [bacterium]|nr:alkaline ceramidase [bacterium]
MQYNIPMRVERIILIFIALSTLMACGPKTRVTVTISHKTPLPCIAGETATAGASQVDITPPPGMPMGGHSLLSCSGRGVRNKLRARVIYIKPANGRPIALIQADLLFGSRIVRHKVAELTASATDIEAAGLLFAGSHTHSAPGNIFGSNFYNAFASNKKGFSKRYFRFLSRRIASAVIQAYDNRKPAKIAMGSVEVPDATVNRSFRAYLKNKDNTNRSSIDKYSAINPMLHMIRIDCRGETGRYNPVAVFSMFSIHANTNPKELGRLYNGDVTTYIQRCLEKSIKDKYQLPEAPIHAVVNLTHGDNNPFYGKGIKETFMDFKRVGCGIAAKAMGCFEKLDDKLTDRVDIGYISKELDLFTENSVDGITIAKKPRLGIAALGGARGRGRSSILSYTPFYGPGLPLLIFNKGEHGRKPIFLWPFQSLIFPKKNFPHFCFLQVIRINDMVLMAVPWEVTYRMGERISHYAAEKGKEAGLAGIDDYLVVSCANGAMSYVNTIEEYSLQYYEGGMNLYGPNSGDFLKTHLGYMVKALADGNTSRQLPKKWTFKLKTAEFLSPLLMPKGKRSIYKAPTEGVKKDEPYWSFKWFDVPPCWIDFHRPLVSIEVSEDKRIWKPLVLEGEPVNDSGADIALIFKGKISKENMGLYESRWYNPPAPGDAYYRFVIQPRMGRPLLFSPAFR